MSLRQPVGIVVIPDQTVSANFHAVGQRELYDLIAFTKVERASCVAHGPPLHRIFGLDHVEFVRQGCRVGGVGKQIGANGGSNQHLSLVGRLPQQERRRGGRGSEKQYKPAKVGARIQHRGLLEVNGSCLSINAGAERAVKDIRHIWAVIFCKSSFRFPQSDRASRCRPELAAYEPLCSWLRAYVQLREWLMQAEPLPSRAAYEPLAQAPARTAPEFLRNPPSSAEYGVDPGCDACRRPQRKPDDSPRRAGSSLRFRGPRRSG